MRKPVAAALVAGALILGLAGCSARPPVSFKGIDFASGVMDGATGLGDVAGRLGCDDVHAAPAKFGAAQVLTCRFEGTPLELYRFTSLAGFENFVAGDNPSGLPAHPVVNIGTKYVIWSFRKATVKRLINLIG